MNYVLAYNRVKLALHYLIHYTKLELISEFLNSKFVNKNQISTSFTKIFPYMSSLTTIEESCIRYAIFRRSYRKYGCELL